MATKPVKTRFACVTGGIRSLVGEKKPTAVYHSSLPQQFTLYQSVTHNQYFRESVFEQRRREIVHKEMHYLCHNDMMTSSVVQYVLVRGDLMKTLKWTLGAVIAQACHACTAVTHMFYDDPITKQYLKDLDGMHKIVLEVPDENCLVELSKVLTEKEVSHKLWVEQPENFPTCLVVKPYPKEEIQMYFKKFKLMK